MIEDFYNFPDGHRLEADLCIVGAGPAGIAIANEFRHSSTRVIVVESGGRAVEPAVQLLNQADVEPLSFGGHLNGRARALGGTSKLWAGQCLPLDPIDLQSRDWVPMSGWPLSREELDPYYQRAAAFFEVGGERYDAGQYERFGLTAPAWCEDLLRTMFTVYTPSPDTGGRYEAVLRGARNIRTVLQASVTAIEANDAGSAARQLVIRNLAGRQATVRSRAFVLAAGGIENARLLLASRGACANGLGNDHDLVGRFFQDHPNAFTATLAEGDPFRLQELFRLFYRRGRRYFPKFSLSPVEQERQSVLNANAHLDFEFPEDSPMAAMQALYRALRGRGGAERLARSSLSVLRHGGELARGALHRIRTGRTPLARPSAVRLQCYLEQAPDPCSRITLSAERDALGTPRAQIDWRMSEMELRTLRAITDSACREFRRLGLGSWQRHAWVEQPGDGWRAHMQDSYHHMGTTRMAESPRRGVVDANAEVFGVKGLYIAGSSLFPTSGYANPTLTIVALALRLSDHLKRVLGS